MPCCFHGKHWLEEGEAGCQFKNSDTPLIDWNGRTYCDFHLPMGTPEPMAAPDDAPSPKAAWDKAKIKAFNNSIFSIIDRAKEANDGADLAGVVFPGKISFARYGADNPLPNITFRSATFSGNTDFKKVAFSKRLVFIEAIFFAVGEFSHSLFSGYTRFRGTKFYEDIIFTKVRFAGYTDFGGAVFYEDAVFLWSNFDSDANFEHATFSGRTNFENATFSLDADFSGFVGPRNADGGKVGATSVTTALEPDRASFRTAIFIDTTFGGACNFNDRRFLKTTSFRGAKFTKAPKFHNAVLHQDTDFTDAEFPDTTNDDAARNYRTLKLAMEKLRARDEEAMFFALEQRSLRDRVVRSTFANILSFRAKQRPPPPRSVMSGAERLASEIYDKTADYGRSFARPLLWMLAVLAVFWFLYFSYIGSVGSPAGPPVAAFGDSVGFAIEQVFRPFAVWGRRYDLPFTFHGLYFAPGWRFLGLKLLATAHSLITLGLFTLFLLALRKRFRMI